MTIISWSRERKNYVLFILCLVAALGLIDRQLIVILLDPLKRNFHATDAQMGLLTGMAYASIYVLAGIPLASFADRGKRCTIIAGSVAVWSCMTMTCSLSTSFIQLALTRMGVALGEAGSNPSSYSIIADLYGPKNRATAIGLLGAASSIGIGFGLFAGGYLSAHFCWRTVFLIVGAPGVVIALLIQLTVKEPPRDLSERGVSVEVTFDVFQVFRWLGRIRTFRFLVFSATVCSMVNYGVQIWAPTFFIRVHDISPRQVGLKLGIASAIGLLVATMGSGLLVDRFAHRDIRLYMRISGGAMLLAIPFGIAAFTLRNDDAAFALYCPTMGLLSCWVTPIYSLSQAIARPRMRALAYTIVAAALNVLGYGVGPWIVGALNDCFYRHFGSGAVRYSLIVTLLAAAGAAAICFLTNRTLRDDYLHATNDVALVLDTMQPHEA